MASEMVRPLFRYAIREIEYDIGHIYVLCAHRSFH
jgi:hypothetical protein